MTGLLMDVPGIEPRTRPGSDHAPQPSHERPTPVKAIAIAVGAVSGALMTLVYFRFLKAQVRGVAEGRGPSALLGLGFLLRMAMLGGVMALLLWWSYPAGVAYALAFLLVRLWALGRLKRGAAGTPPTPLPDHKDPDQDSPSSSAE